MAARTSREIEVKLPVSDLTAIILQLQSLGAVPFGRVFEQNTLYDTSGSDFRHTGRLLRLRVESPARSALIHAGPAKAVLTSKAPVPPGAQQRRFHKRDRGRYKEKLETELAIESPRRWPRILETLGFRPGFRYEKYRSTFRLRNLHLDLDETPVGIFLELEGRPKAIDSVAHRLGYMPREYVRLTYWDLYAANCRRRGLEPANMLFDT